MTGHRRPNDRAPWYFVEADVAVLKHFDRAGIWFRACSHSDRKGDDTQVPRSVGGSGTGAVTLTGQKVYANTRRKARTSDPGQAKRCSETEKDISGLSEDKEVFTPTRSGLLHRIAVGRFAIVRAADYCGKTSTGGKP